MGDEEVGRPQVDPRHLRRAQPLNHLLPVTHRWIARLPAEIRPLSLLRKFPRIANVLARAWPDAQTYAASIDALLHDQRGGRLGFPVDVQSELLMLRAFIEGRYPASPGRS